MEKAGNDKRAGLSQQQEDELLEKTNGMVFYNKTQAILYLIRYVFENHTINESK